MRFPTRIALAATMITLLGLGAELISLGFMESPDRWGDLLRARTEAPYSPCAGTDATGNVDEAAGVSERHVVIDVSETQVDLEYRFAVTGDECLDRLIGGVRERALARVHSALFGSTTINGNPIQPETLALQPIVVDPERKEAPIVIRASVPIDRYASIVLEAFPSGIDSIRFVFRGMLPRSMYPRPFRMTADAAEYRATVRNGIPRVYVYANPSVPTHSGRVRDESRAMLRHVGAILDATFVGGLLGLLAPIVPLATYLRLRAVRRPWGTTKSDRALARPTRVLVLVAALAAVATVATRLDSSDFVQGWSEVFEDWLRAHDVFPTHGPVLGRGVDLLVTIVTPLILTPTALIGARDRPSNAAWRARLTRAVIGSVVLSGVAIPAHVMLEGRPAVRGYYFILAIAIGWMLVWGTVEAIGRVTSGSATRPGTILFVLGAVTILPFVQSWPPMWDWMWIVWALIITAISSAGLRLLGRFLVVATGRSFTLADWRRRATAAVLLTVVAMPWGPVLRGELRLSAWFHSSTTAGVTDTLIPLMLLAWLVAAVWALREDGQEMTPCASAQVICVVATSALIYPVRPEWGAVPLTFLLGIAALSWTVRDGRRSNEHRHDGVREVMQHRRALAESLVKIRLAESAVRAYRRKRVTALASGDIDFTTFENELQARQENLDGLKTKLRENAVADPQMAISVGPYETAWDNAMHGARWAAILALPWITISASGVLAQSAHWLYPHWSIVYNLAIAVGRWVALGFVLGYLYPYLPGRSGMGKGFALFVVATGPFVLTTGLASVRDQEWQALVLLVLQVFVHCMLLGLYAFDFTVLRESLTDNRDWRIIFDVHGVPAIGVSLSTIALAVGTGVTALLGTQATTLVTTALKLSLALLDPTAPSIPPGSSAGAP